jgi:hypothetical protein
LMVTLDVLDHGELLSISFDDLVKYHGRSSIGGVAHGFKVMERAFPLLRDGQAPERYDVDIETAFPGPGARDAFEMVTRAVTGGRYRVIPELAAADAPIAPEGHYVFRLRCHETTVDLTLRPGHVRDDFVQLVRQPDRTAADEERLVWLKQEMAARLMSLPAEEVYDAAATTHGADSAKGGTIRPPTM